MSCIVQIQDGGLYRDFKVQVLFEKVSVLNTHALGNYRTLREIRIIESSLRTFDLFLSITDSPDSWEWKKTSEIHRQKFEKLHEYGRHSPETITEINDVRVCFKKAFLINRGSDGTSVFVGLSKDGGERAVKRLVRVMTIFAVLWLNKKRRF